MNACRLSIFTFLPLLLLASSPIRAAESGDWPAWRGPHGNGVASADQNPPTVWSERENVLWKTPVPGRGYSSPTVVGPRVLLATAEEDRQIQAVICYDRATGKQLWKTEVHRGNLDDQGNKKATQASSSVAYDGERLFINFLNNHAVYTTALDLDGQQLWQTKVSDFKTHQGFGSSPTVHGDFVYVTTDNPAGGVIAALRRKDGKIAWRVQRPEEANYASAQILKLHGKEQLLLQGCGLVASYDPRTGQKNWEMEGSTVECVTSIVTDGKHIFVSGGYPRNHVQAIVADGSRQTAWENGARVYVPSMIVRDGYLYAMQDAGIATCWECASGKEMWKSRVGGDFTASLVLVGEHLYAVSERGKSVIFKANPQRFSLVAENQLGDEAFATPSICGGQIFMRVVKNADGHRQEWLYCLGSK
jgi:outer membrane protein assembly factor BamB